MQEELEKSDWRADLLTAVHNIFAKEKEGLLTDIHSHRVASGDGNALTLKRLEEMVQRQVRSV